MRLKDHWANYAEYTQGITLQCRTLAFGSAALCWLFKTDTFIFPVAIFFLVLFFICDILQYSTAAFGLRKWLYTEESARSKPLNSDENIPKPKKLDKYPFFFFSIKILFLFLSFLSIGVELIYIIRIN